MIHLLLVQFTFWLGLIFIVCIFNALGVDPPMVFKIGLCWIWMLA